jgi:hypothetical protein
MNETSLLSGSQGDCRTWIAGGDGRILQLNLVVEGFVTLPSIPIPTLPEQSSSRFVILNKFKVKHYYKAYRLDYNIV